MRRVRTISKRKIAAPISCTQPQPQPQSPTININQNLCLCKVKDENRQCKFNKKYGNYCHLHNDKCPPERQLK